MTAIERTIRDAVPAFADFCLVHLVRGATIRCVAAVHVSRNGQTLLRALMRQHTIRRDDLVSSVAHVVRTERPLLRPQIREESGGADGKSGITQMHRRLGARSVLVVPVVAGAAVVGALSLCYSVSGRRYAARHLAPARRMAGRIASLLMARPPAGLTAPPPRRGTFPRRRVASPS